MENRQLMEALEMELEIAKLSEYVFKDKETGEEYVFQSMLEASRQLQGLSHIILGK